MPSSLIRRSPLPSTRSSESTLSSAYAYSVAYKSDPFCLNGVAVPGSYGAAITQQFDPCIPMNGQSNRLILFKKKHTTGPGDVAATSTLNGHATPPTFIGRSSDVIDPYEATSRMEAGGGFGARTIQTCKAESYVQRPNDYLVGWSFSPGSEYPFVDLNLDSWKVSTVAEELCEKNPVVWAQPDSKVSPKELAHYAIHDAGLRNATGLRNELPPGTSKVFAMAGEIFGSTKSQANSKDSIGRALGDSLASDRPSDARPAAQSVAPQQAGVAGDLSDVQCSPDEREPFKDLPKPVYPVRSLSRPKLHSLLPPKLARSITQESLETLNPKSGDSRESKARRRPADATDEHVPPQGSSTQVRSNIASIPTSITPQMILSSSHARAVLFAAKRRFTDETGQLMSAIPPKMLTLLENDQASTTIDMRRNESRCEASLDTCEPTDKHRTPTASRRRKAPAVVRHHTEVSERCRYCGPPPSLDVKIEEGHDPVDYHLMPFGGVCIDAFWPPHAHASSTTGRIVHGNDSASSVDVLGPLDLNNCDCKKMTGSASSRSIGISNASTYQGIKHERDCEDCASEEEFPQTKRLRIF
ncbi:hypothetical protein BD410DRAFT_835192 [Rickenella mellea]|uniref:Uncharacterized protein n=1 Tax=Rickenella mellea TaxID=50990 RepID=A0A4Y7QJU7_9AGAM|nr:hypothetical protein BD410DRAFT_835192 [Rickenella mellea]